MNTSKATNGSEFLWSEGGVAQQGPVALVAPNLPINKTYSFSVPPELEPSVLPGRRVLVPIGRKGRLVDGLVLEIDQRTWDDSLRPIDSIVDGGGSLPAELIALGREVATHYACPLGKTLDAMMPEAVRRERGLRSVHYARLATNPQPEEQPPAKLSPKRANLLRVITDAGDLVAVKTLLEEANVSRGVLDGLVKLGLVEIITRREASVDVDIDAPLKEPDFQLNDAQLAALNEIKKAMDDATFSVSLLFGVSGSGKTEVYVHAMRHALAAGRQAILLVPEIVLTTQLVTRLVSRFSHVAVSHSGLTDAQRSIIWRQVAAGEKQVIIGTRSAVFAPCPNLGLICVDEEQEGSYKNLRAPRFHVRDVAVMRAKQLGIPVVLGSATPSLELWHRCDQRADHHRLRLDHRVANRPMPRVHLIDMQEEVAETKSGSPLSRSMERLLSEAFDRGEQALLLINRRGYATRSFCPACKSHVKCLNCNIALVLHAPTGQSVCHHCHTRIDTPTVCPVVTCRQPLVKLGQGTQKIEEFLRHRFSKVRLERVDSDTMSHRRDYERIVNDFEAKRIDALIGTQMIAKGLDFPFVSFVGIFDADPAGMGADFRASERLFQLVTQMAGRAGRAETSGTVVVQTTMPSLPALQFSLNHDYDGFAADELEVRSGARLPPYRRLARIVFSHQRPSEAQHIATRITQSVRTAADVLSMGSVELIGPNACPMKRLRGKYRYELLIYMDTAAELRQLLGHLQAEGRLRAGAGQLMIDVDPVSMW